MSAEAGCLCLCLVSQLMRSVYSYGPLRKCGMAISSEARQASRAPHPMNRGRWTRLPKKLTKTMRTVLPTCRDRQAFESSKFCDGLELVMRTAVATNCFRFKHLHTRIYCTLPKHTYTDKHTRTHKKKQKITSLLRKEGKQTRLASKTSRNTN